MACAERNGRLLSVDGARRSEVTVMRTRTPNTALRPPRPIKRIGFAPTRRNRKRPLVSGRFGGKPLRYWRSGRRTTWQVTQSHTGSHGDPGSIVTLAEPPTEAHTMPCGHNRTDG